MLGPDIAVADARFNCIQVARAHSVCNVSNLVQHFAGSNEDKLNHIVGMRFYDMGPWQHVAMDIERDRASRTFDMFG